MDNFSGKNVREILVLQRCPWLHCWRLSCPGTRRLQSKFGHCQELVTVPSELDLEHWVVSPAGRDWLIINTQSADWDPESCFLPLPPLQAPSQISSFSFLQLSTVIHTYIWSCKKHSSLNIASGTIDQTGYKLTSSRFPVFWHLTVAWPAPACWPDKCLVQWRQGGEDQCRTPATRTEEGSPATLHWHHGKWDVASWARSVILYINIHIHTCHILLVFIQKLMFKFICLEVKATVN